jgi:predicted DNA-binding transcriptional regulator AlpA
MDILIRVKKISQLTGLSSSTIYRYTKLGKFPPMIRIGPRINVWSYDAVVKWIQDRLDGVFLEDLNLSK